MHFHPYIFSCLHIMLYFFFARHTPCSTVRFSLQRLECYFILTPKIHNDCVTLFHLPLSHPFLHKSSWVVFPGAFSKVYHFVASSPHLWFSKVFTRPLSKQLRKTERIRPCSNFPHFTFYQAGLCPPSPLMLPVLLEDMPPGHGVKRGLEGRSYWACFTQAPSIRHKAQ